MSNGYLEGYFTVSHPQIIPHRQHRDDDGPSHAKGNFDDVSLPPPPPQGTDDAQCLQMITIIMVNLMGLVNPNSEVYTLTSRETHLARVGPI